MDQFSFKVQEKNILVYRSVFTPVKSNMYVILTGKDAVVFDPNENEKLLQLLKREKIEQVHILLTHEHYDHTNGVKWLQKSTGADVNCSKDCAKVISTERGNNPALVAFVLANLDKQDGGQRYKDFKMNFKPYSIDVQKSFNAEDEIQIEGLTFQVTATPGHCPGSACYKLFDKIVFTGDTLLQNDPVVLGFRESNKELYQQVALPYLRSLSKDTIILPGHGDPFLLKDTKNI